MIEEALLYMVRNLNPNRQNFLTLSAIDRQNLQQQEISYKQTYPKKIL